MDDHLESFRKIINYANWSIVFYILLLPFLNTGITLEIFHISGNCEFCRKIIERGFAKIHAQSRRKNEGIFSGPTIPLGFIFFKHSNTSSSVTFEIVIELYTSLEIFSLTAIGLDWM